MNEDKKTERSTSAKTGRESNGAFAKGNQLSVGNKGKSSETVRKLKKALIDAITEADIKNIAVGLKNKARQGDVPAAREIFDRLWGRAKQDIDLGANEDLTTFIDWLVNRDGHSENTG